MKKTIIALIAISCVVGSANAEQYTLATEWVTAPTTAGDFYAGAWTFTFTLDESYTIANSGSVLGAWWAPGAYGSNGVGSNAIYLTENNGVLTLSVGRGALNNTKLDNTTTFTLYNDGANDYVTRVGAIQKGVTYTLTASLTTADSGKTGLLEISDNLSGSWITETGTGTNYKNNMAGAGGNGQNVTMSYGANVGVVAPIPEPTTATLSLLALAGLAARRRRK